MENPINAIEQLASVYRANPGNMGLAQHLAQSYSDQGWYNEALDIYKEILKKYPNDYSLLLEYGNLCYRRKDFKEAVASFKKLTQIKPERIEGWNNAGIAQIQTGEIGAAKISFSKVLEIEPANAGALLNMGNYHFNSKELDAARSYFMRATEICPDFADAWFNLGNVYIAETKYNDALNALKKALKYEPEFASALKNMGYVYEMLGDYERAEESYLKASELNKVDAFLQVSLGSICFNKKKYDDAKKYFLKAIRLSPNELSGWLGIRRLALVKGDLNTYIRATFAVLPRLSEEEIASSIHTLCELNQYSKAEEILNQADKLGKTGDELDAQRLILYHRKGTLEGKVSSIYKKLSEKAVVSDEIHKGLSRYALEIGAYDKVVEHINKMKNPGPDGYGFLWRALIGKNEIDSAKSRIESYAKYHPECFDCWFLLAQIESNGGDLEKAEKLLICALENGFTNIEEIRKIPNLNKIFNSLMVDHGVISDLS